MLFVLVTLIVNEQNSNFTSILSDMNLSVARKMIKFIKTVLRENECYVKNHELVTLLVSVCDFLNVFITMIIIVN